MAKLWGARFSGGLDPLFERFNRSLPFDQRLLAADIEGSRAWASALGRAGVLTDAEVGRITEALERVGTDVAADPSRIADSDAEDVHSFVEGALTDLVGDLARKLHTGRSRNDQVATDLRLWLRGALADLDAAMKGAIAALVDLAEQHAATAMPGYTHLQRAQPVTLGHHALAYAEMLGRDRSRLADAGARMDTCPLGCGALAGTAFTVDRDVLARELGFTGGPTRNSLDTVSDRDHVCEVAFVCSLTMVHLSRLAEDWIFFASHDVGFIRFSDAVATGSSLMPQKKNPDAMELIRGKTGRVTGDLAALLMTLKGLPLAYDKDLQEDKEALFDALDTTTACLHITATATRGLSVDTDRCAAAAERGYMNATDLADLLVRHGVPFRDAHERTGAAVTRAEELGVELHELPPEVQRELLPELDQDLAAELAVERVLARRAEVGGTSPERVLAEVARWKEALSS